MDNEALVRRAIEGVWNRGELAVADELFGPGYVNHGGLIPDLVRGPEAIKISAALCRLAFPDLHILLVTEMSADKETVLIHWTARREVPGPANSTIVLDPRLLTGTTRTRLSEGQIVESWTHWDGAPQLQVIPSGSPPYDETS